MNTKPTNKVNSTERRNLDHQKLQLHHVAVSYWAGANWSQGLAAYLPEIDKTQSPFSL